MWRQSTRVSLVNDPQYENTKLCYLVKNDMTLMFVSTNFRAKRGSNPPHSRIVCQKPKAMLEVAGIFPGLKLTEYIEAKDEYVEHVLVRLTCQPEFRHAWPSEALRSSRPPQKSRPPYAD